MHNLFYNIKHHIFPIGLVLILTFSRLIPHPPNFTPIIAIAMMSGYFFRNIYFSLGILLISMLLADVLIGFYNNMIFVYLSLCLITFFFYKISKMINLKNLFIFGFLGSLTFFIISNFGVWAMGSLGAYGIPYEKNLNGLMECYILAIPFFGNTFLSTLIFSYSVLVASKLYYKELSQKN